VPRKAAFRNVWLYTRAGRQRSIAPAQPTYLPTAQRAGCSARRRSATCTSCTRAGRQRRIAPAQPTYGAASGIQCEASFRDVYFTYTSGATTKHCARPTYLRHSERDAVRGVVPRRVLHVHERGDNDALRPRSKPSLSSGRCWPCTDPPYPHQCSSLVLASIPSTSHPLFSNVSVRLFHPSVSATRRLCRLRIPRFW
jgi:hypothetical protein